jgi:acyl dehydratase
MPLYLEDLIPGFTVVAGPITVTAEDIIAFARQYDPQTFHTDPASAEKSMFGGLIASGWHTAALSMRMLVQSRFADVANGLIGVEVRHMRWPQPTRPGDELQLTVEVLETKQSRSRPGWGTVFLRWTTRNQRGEAVMELENVAWVKSRPRSDS